MNKNNLFTESPQAPNRPKHPEYINQTQFKEKNQKQLKKYLYSKTISTERNPNLFKFQSLQPLLANGNQSSSSVSSNEKNSASQFQRQNIYDISHSFKILPKLPMRSINYHIHSKNVEYTECDPKHMGLQSNANDRRIHTSNSNTNSRSSHSFMAFQMSSSMNLHNKKLLKNNNNTDSSDVDSINEDLSDSTKVSSEKNKIENDPQGQGETDNKITAVFYVDSSSLWRFPTWLVERLDLEHSVANFSSLSVQAYTNILIRQIKSTSTDLMLYQTVRREFLRTILIIELNNIVKLMEHIGKLGLDINLKNNIFKQLKAIVGALDDPEKNYIPEMEEMARELDALYMLIAPSHVMKGLFSYHFNIVYCSFLLSNKTMTFNERCIGGIVDNTWFANESRYMCMIMITPQVYDDSLKMGVKQSNPTKFRVEAYFDVEKGRFGGFEKSFASSLQSPYDLTRTLECLIYSYLTRDAHWVEDKNIFLLNGPDIKGKTDFTKIYFCLNKKATI